MIDFFNAVDDVTGGQYKVLKRDYLSEGRIPVIDQGHTFIAGYANNDDAIFNGKLPVVLFGDHTLVLKYVDFPFALGADGVKVLSINNSHVPKYVYYYWQSCDIQSRGYSRHFKYLRDIQIPLIPISEQRRIVEILDQADALRKKRAEADAKAARILPSLFYKMFGDPATNMNEGKWSLKRIGAVADISYGLADRLDTGLKAEEGTRIITISNVTINGEVNNAVARYTKADNAMLKKARLKNDDLLFNWRNGSKEHIGKTAIWENNWSGDVLHVSFLLRIRANKEQIEPYYLWVLINLLRFGGFFTAQSRMQINNKFNASELSNLIIPVPPLELQSVFKEKLLFLRETARMNTEASLKINNLFDTLLHQAFTGGLTAKWREAHMKKLLAEMEMQSKALGYTNYSKGSVT